MRITKLQLAMLAEVAAQGYLGGRGARSCRGISRLEKMGLIEDRYGQSGSWLTEAGKNALKTEAGQAVLKVATEAAKSNPYARPEVQQ